MTPLIATILLMGLVCGILYKTYAPYARKLKAGTIDKFDTRYLWTAIGAFIGALVSALGLFDAAAISWSQGWPFGTGYFAVFGFGFLWALGWNYGAHNVLPPQPVQPDAVQPDELKEARLV